MPRVRRFEFSPRARQLVAQRAGYRCSFPGCDRLTTGPGDDPESASTIGQAAHIYGAAASGRGPRGTHALTGDELRSRENALWLCADYASLIDKHGGRDYPAARLHSFKSLHESRVAHELRGYAVPFGWVDGVTIHSSPLFSDSARIDLAKLNLVLARNSVSKTALCEWISGHVGASHLERWHKVYPPTRRRLRTEMLHREAGHTTVPDPHAALRSKSCLPTRGASTYGQSRPFLTTGRPDVLVSTPADPRDPRAKRLAATRADLM